jgi:hypothetical protein
MKKLVFPRKNQVYPCTKLGIAARFSAPCPPFGRRGRGGRPKKIVELLKSVEQKPASPFAERKAMFRQLSWAQKGTMRPKKPRNFRENRIPRFSKPRKTEKTLHLTGRNNSKDCENAGKTRSFRGTENGEKEESPFVVPALAGSKGYSA